MTSIYEQAERVVIWLGQATSETDLVFDYIHQVRKEAEKHGHSILRSSEEQWLTVGSSVQPLHGQARRDLVAQQQRGLRSLLSQPWFTRVWIIQEVAKARSAQVLCGTRSVSTYDFASIPAMVGMRPDPHCQAILDIMPGPTRKHSWWNQNRDLYTLLLKFKDSKASDPRDVIYALLGISSDGSGSGVLKPGYEKPLEKVIQDAITFLLRLHRKNGDMLCLPRWTLPEFLRHLETLDDAVFIWAAEEGHEATVKTLLNINEVDVNFKAANDQTPLLLAAKNGHEATVELLLSADKVDVDFKDKNGQTPLLLASKNGHNAVVKLLLNTNNTDVNVRDEDGQTPLLLAAENGHEAVVELLIMKDGIDTDLGDALGWTPRLVAALRGHRIIVELLLSFEKEIEEMTIHETARKGRKLISELLLKAEKTSFDPEASQRREPPLWWASINGHEEIVKLLLKTGKVDLRRPDKRRETLFTWAIHHRRVAIVKLLLVENDEIGTDLKDEYLLLSWAVDKGYDDILDILLKRGKIELERKDTDGDTLLWRAAARGHAAVVRLLLNTGEVDINRKNVSGQTPLWRAAWRGHIEVVKLLVHAGIANIDWKDSQFEQTPLSVAAEFGYKSVVRFLLSTGKVDVNSEDHNGRTPLWWAAQKGNSTIVKLLSEKGGEKRGKEMDSRRLMYEKLEL